MESNALALATNEQRPLPKILVNHSQLRNVGQQALAALTRLNDNLVVPRLYIRSGEPVRVRRDEVGVLRIQDLTLDLALYELTRAADFIHYSERSGIVAVYPPRDVARYVLSAPGWAMPALSEIITIPTFRPDGSVLDSRGYDTATGLIYDPPDGFEVSVPDTPTEDDVHAALALVDEWIGQFPYADQASLANTLALALTPVLREVITGPVPLAAIDKPSPGTGATLLVESLAVATSGTEPGALGVTDDDDETRKQITAKLRTGERWLFLDNVAVELKSSSLARALTATEWEDRILGVSNPRGLPQRAVWVATGNNLALSLEIARRCYWIRLDAEVDKPWERDPNHFAHPDLKDWTRRNGARILSALLTIARRWFAEGKPVPDDAPSLGGFESWSRTLAGVLHATGVEGFLGNSGQLYEKATEDTGSWEAFLDAWRTAYGVERVAARTIAEDLYKEDYAALRQALPDEFGLLDENLRDKNLAKRLGHAFSKREGVRYGPKRFHLARAGTKSRAVLWIVRRGDDPEGDEMSSMGSLSFSSPPPRARARA